MVVPSRILESSGEEEAAAEEASRMRMIDSFLAARSAATCAVGAAAGRAGEVRWAPGGGGRDRQGQRASSAGVDGAGRRVWWPTVALGAEAAEDVLMVVSTAAIWRAAAAAAVESLPAAWIWSMLMEAAAWASEALSMTAGLATDTSAVWQAWAPAGGGGGGNAARWA